MSWYNADITRRELYKLHLSRCSSGESKRRYRQAAQTEWVIGSLEYGPQLCRTLEFVDADAILKGDDDMSSRKAYTTDGREDGDLNSNLLLCIIPDDDL